MSNMSNTDYVLMRQVGNKCDRHNYKFNALLNENLDLLLLDGAEISQYLQSGEINIKNCYIDDKGRLLARGGYSDDIHKIALQKVSGLVQKLNLMGYTVYDKEYRGRPKTYTAYKVTDTSADVIWIIPDDVIDISYKGESLNNKEELHIVTLLSAKGIKVRLKVIGGNNIVDASHMLSVLPADSLDLTAFNANNLLVTNSMFSYCKTNKISFGNFDTSKVINMDKMFFESGIESIEFDKISTKSAESMKLMFHHAKLDSMNLSKLDTSNVMDMSAMFCRTKLDGIDLSKLDTSNTIDMSSMFSEVRASSLNLNNFDTTKVTSFDSMFESAEIGTLNLSSFNTTSAATMTNMFNDACIHKLILGDNFKLNTNTNINSMFKYTHIDSIEAPNRYITEIFLQQSNY